MEYSVVKSGAEMFDALHAYGLAILLACASGSPVELRDEGITYRLSCPIRAALDASVDLLNQMLAMPALEEVEAVEKQYGQMPLAITNLDGLLAALFTTPGVRVISVRDLLGKRHFRPTVLQDALKKAHTAITRLRAYADRVSRRAQTGWLPDLLQDYDAAHPQSPRPAAKSNLEIAIPMTIEPVLSYSTRRQFSDGLVADKTNVAIRGPRYAGLLVLVGAARFLRAQRVAGNQVNFYVPLIDSMTVAADTSLPILFGTEHPTGQAIVSRWLSYRMLEQSLGDHWISLGYHVMQTQGTQQSISLDRGFLDYAWLRQVEERAGSRLVGYWRRLLQVRREQAAFEVDNLVDCLSSRRTAAWFAHLRDMALYLHSNPETATPIYRVEELKEVTSMVTLTHPLLSAVLDRDQGTLRFGRALRLLGQQKPSSLREIVETLDTVRTCDQLARVLAWAAQECAVASAHSEFIVIPDEYDLRCLLDDVEQYGAQSVAGLLIILSALRYPRRANAEVPEETPVPAGVTLEGGENDGYR